MEGNADSTQTNIDGGSSEPVRFVKPCSGEVNDLMPEEAEIDPDIANSEPSRYFVRRYTADGVFSSDIPLKKYVPVFVGRAMGCQIDIVEPSISRRHCAFQYKDLVINCQGEEVSGYMIYDLKSSHGTFLNGERIPSMENIKLKHGDKVTLGFSKLCFMFWDSKHYELPEENQTETPDEQLMIQQQPSSTSQHEDDTTTWFERYSKLLGQVSNMTKHLEDGGVAYPDHLKSKSVLKKFQIHQQKLLKQVNAAVELLDNTEPQTPDTAAAPKQPKRKIDEVDDTQPVKKRGRKKREAMETESNEPKVDDVNDTQPIKKRGRKKREATETENNEPKKVNDVDGTQPVKKRGRKKREATETESNEPKNVDDVQQKLAKEVQKQIKATLSHSLNEDDSPPDSEASVTPVTREKRTIKPNKRYIIEENILAPVKIKKTNDQTALENPEKKRRGRKPKTLIQDENPEHPPKLPDLSQSEIHLQEESSFGENETVVTNQEIQEEIHVTAVPKVKKRGRPRKNPDLSNSEVSLTETTLLANETAVTSPKKKQEGVLNSPIKKVKKLGRPRKNPVPSLENLMSTMQQPKVMLQKIRIYENCIEVPSKN